MSTRRHSLALLLTVLLLALATRATTVAAQPRRSALPIAQAALPQRTADADADAVALAKRVLAGGDDATAALLQALPEAGFTVLNDDGSVLAAPSDAGQGLAFGAWELQAMLAGEGSFSTTLGNTGQALAGAIPELAGAPLDQFLLQGLQAAANGSNPDLRFWARFIAALGQQAPQPTDLTTASDPAAVSLDTVQLTLIMRRLAGDLAGFALENGAPAASAPSAVYLAARRPLAPCTLTDTESTILDTNALVTGTGFSALLDYLGEHLSEAGQAVSEAIGDVTSLANVALAYAQAVWTAADFHVTMALDGSGPLVRTKQAKPATGELRQANASVSLTLDNAQIANCLRGALNLAGLDFSLPNGGPVSGAETRWYPGDGFDQNIIQFHDNPLGHTTDANGNDSVGIEGVGQDEDLPDDVQPVMKPASVGIAVRLSPASLFSALETGVGAAAAGPAGVVAVLPSVLQQTDWFYDGVLRFQVQDWQQVHFHGEGTNDYSMSVSYGPGSEESDQFSQHDTFSIDFDAPGEGKLITGSGTLTVSMTSHNTRFKQSCTDQENRTYNIAVSGTEVDGVLGLVLTLDGGPMPSCLFAYTTDIHDPGTYPPVTDPQGSVFLPDQSADALPAFIPGQADPGIGQGGRHVGVVKIPAKDGATLDLTYVLPWPIEPSQLTQQGHFTLTLHQANPGQ